MTQAQARRQPSRHHMRARYFTYRKWVEREAVPSITGHFVEDLRTVDVFPWARKGGKGVFLNLSDQEVTDAYVLELPETGNTPEQRDGCVGYAERLDRAVALAPAGNSDS